MPVISVSGSGRRFRKSDAPRSGCGRISALAIRSTPWSVIAGLSNSARRRATEGRSRGTGAARDRQACQARAASACRPDPVPPRKGQPLGTGTSPHWPAATSHQASPAATRTLPPPPHTTRPECSSPAAFRSPSTSDATTTVASTTTVTCGPRHARRVCCNSVPVPRSLLASANILHPAGDGWARDDPLKLAAQVLLHRLRSVMLRDPPGVA